MRLKRVDLPADLSDVYRRMESERKRVANELRATGQAEGEKIRAEADRQRQVTVAEAYRDAQRIKGEGDAQAARDLRRGVPAEPRVLQLLPQHGGVPPGHAHQGRRDGAGPELRLLQVLQEPAAAASSRPRARGDGRTLSNTRGGFALMFVFEGILPFVAPRCGARPSGGCELTDGQLRFFGLVSMVAGLRCSASCAA